MKNKVIVGFLSAALVTGGGFYTYSNHVEAVESKRVEAQQTETITDIQKRVDKLYSNSKKEFLSKGINYDQIQVIKRDLENQEGKGFTTDNAVKLNTAIMELSDAENMLQLQTLVQGLLDQKGVLIENAAISKASEKASNLKGIKPAFADQQLRVINVAKQQDVQLKDSTKKVHSLFLNLQQKKVRPEVNQQQLEAIKKQVSQIKQENTKKGLMDLLNVVGHEIKKKEQSKMKVIETPQEQRTTNQHSSVKPSKPKVNESSSSLSENKKVPNNHDANTSRNSNKQKSNNTGSSKPFKEESEDKPGTTWEGTTTNQGQMKSDSGRSWGTIDW
ncbi:hypothetical protein IHV12_19720 [Fictibacillus sp. 7GRE50]|uniref:hypothetical protein n=1 Tax=Fictibacillus sp. 7GRE50 TaxID=2745878 RepID=UPI0018CE293B|nr:hypothetical protein [Fictibacillus sp. 7GRE50]MBH0167157.1 hypothetical protein [Fictibacillus sp. 7GRE50]